ncbi:CDP-alcohol phosphatidyltransferase family protein [Intrasporangium flavum]|uniref:CDP-alcohol phosphatidyltransferase family protein n=1 Tax=Intrasporangium flavum TaxID=1428657 RepID=UPI00096C6893|nr:CDP-alcohol phosphatidyltransferase family protein [Intrasporangium flavum]
MVHRGPAVGFATATALVLGLTLVAGVGAQGAAVGFACAAVLFVLVTVGLAASGRRLPGPADRVTLLRAVLTCGVAALVTDAAVGPAGADAGTRTAALVVLASVGLSLDAVDGRVARRTGTVSAFGARFDMESDAVLILVLAVHVAGDLGQWVLAVGAARYLLLLAQRFAPWLRRGVPARRWRKAVAAYQGVGLTAAASGLLAPAVAVGVVGLGLAALAVSFGTEAATLWRLRGADGATERAQEAAAGARATAVPALAPDGRAVVVTMSGARVVVAQRRSG